MVRSLIVFTCLLSLKILSKIFFRLRVKWVQPAPRRMDDVRILALLNHTSLFEPIFLGGVPTALLWRLARFGVVPLADKTTRRPLVGRLFRAVAYKTIPITRKADASWDHVLASIDAQSLVGLAPEGRMKRPTGLDSQGQVMNVRGGIADVLAAVGHGSMLVVYSGGLHHVQVPGGFPRLFKRVSMHCEMLDIATYVATLREASGPDNFRQAVCRDLERRRDEHAAAMQPRRRPEPAARQAAAQMFASSGKEGP